MVESADDGKPNLLAGIGAGFAVAVVSSVLWFGIVVLTKIQFGIVAVVVGIIIGYGVLKGAGGRTDRRLQTAGVALSLFGMALSEYLIANHFINQALAEEAEGRYLPLIIPPTTMAEIVVESLKADPLTMVFWAIAVYQVYKTLEPKYTFRLPATQSAQG